MIAINFHRSPCLENKILPLGSNVLWSGSNYFSILISHNLLFSGPAIYNHKVPVSLISALVYLFTWNLSHAQNLDVFLFIFSDTSLSQNLTSKNLIIFYALFKIQSKLHLEIQGIQKSQNKDKAKGLIQSKTYSNQESMVLAQAQTHSSTHVQLENTYINPYISA